MPKQLHVSNLSPTVNECDLTRLFASHGTVRRAEVFRSSTTGAASATGRVDMECDAEGDAAIERLNGQEYCGCLLAVGWATPRQVATSGDAPLFNSMNMAEESVPLVSHGSAPVDFGDRPGSGRDRGLPPASRQEGASPPAAVGDGVRVLPPASPAPPDRTTGMSAAQKSTYDGIFQRPVVRDLRWSDVRSMLGRVADVTVGEDGSIKALRSGKTLVLPRPRKNVASVQEVMDIRRFFERSDTASNVEVRP
jgi:hypothetical protein